MNSKNTLVRTKQDDYTTDDELSITERCDKSLGHSSLGWQTGTIVDTATHSTHSSLVVSQTNRLTRQYERTSAPSPYSKTWRRHKLRQKMFKKMSSNQTDVLFSSTLGKTLGNSLCLSPPESFWFQYNQSRWFYFRVIYSLAALRYKSIYSTSTHNYTSTTDLIVGNTRCFSLSCETEYETFKAPRCGANDHMIITWLTTSSVYETCAHKLTNSSAH